MRNRVWILGTKNLLILLLREDPQCRPSELFPLNERKQMEKISDKKRFLYVYTVNPSFMFTRSIPLF